MSLLLCSYYSLLCAECSDLTSCSSSIPSFLVALRGPLSVLKMHKWYLDRTTAAHKISKPTTVLCAHLTQLFHIAISLLYDLILTSSLV